jgi:hypothetical protein
MVIRFERFCDSGNRDPGVVREKIIQECEFAAALTICDDPSNAVSVAVLFALTKSCVNGRKASNYTYSLITSGS